MRPKQTCAGHPGISPFLPEADSATSAQRVHFGEEPATRARRAPWGTKLLDGLERDCQTVVGGPPEQVRQQCRTAPQVASVAHRMQRSWPSRHVMPAPRRKKIAAISRDRPTTCPALGSSAKAHRAPALRFSANRPDMIRLRDSRSCSPANKSPGTRRADAGNRAEK